VLNFHRLHLRALQAYELEGVTWLLGKVLLRVYLEHYIELHTSWFACQNVVIVRTHAALTEVNAPELHPCM
jgi:hypothetical protein